MERLAYFIGNESHETRVDFMRECLRCGYDEFQRCIDKHHVKYGEDEYLIDLCCNCHMAIHRCEITYDRGVFRPFRGGDVPPSGKKKGRRPKSGNSRWDSGTSHARLMVDVLASYSGRGETNRFGREVVR